MHETVWICQCGQVELAVDTARGTRAVCYCSSCRGFVTRLGAAEILDPSGGNDLYQVSSEAAVFRKGADKVAWTRMTAKGPARWFTTCCHSPLANTLTTRAIPFLTLQSAYIGHQGALGDIHIRAFVDSAVGTEKPVQQGLGRLYGAFALRAFRSRLSGGWRRHPLFDKDGRMIGAQVPLNDLPTP